VKAAEIEGIHTDVVARIWENVPGGKPTQMAPSSLTPELQQARLEQPPNKPLNRAVNSSVQLTLGATWRHTGV
jgi:hypothetical protein